MGEQDLIFQEPPQPLSSKAVLDRVYDYLNYPFIKNNDFKITLLSLLIFIFVIFTATLVSRLIRGFLDKRVMPRFSNVDSGLKYTLLRVLHYVIIILGIVYGLKAGMGADLTGIAVVLGFLSVGIGFGLQAITGDITSGFILLFERPLRVGDYLKLGEMEGRVTQINLRSTMVVTNDLVTIIVPNSELVKNRVINWSYSPKVRIKIPIETSENSDLNQVIETLTKGADGVAHVLTDPKPKVRFLGHGDSSLRFDLLIWTDAPHDYQQIRSDVNCKIHHLFNETGVSTPKLQRDFNLRGGVIQFNKKKRVKDKEPSKNEESTTGELLKAFEESKIEAKVIVEE
jgi:small-conductance mechanosensitive channel